MVALAEHRRSIATVLLVDDSDPVLNGWARELGHEDLHVLRAKSRSEVRALLRKRRPDLALVDLYLGSESGLDIVRDIKDAAPEAFVIVVTGAPSVAYTVEAVRAGADDVFAKPIHATDMVRVAMGDTSTPPPGQAATLEQVEWEHIQRVLADCNGNVSEAARRLGIYRQTLQRKLRKYVPRSESE